MKLNLLFSSSLVSAVPLALLYDRQEASLCEQYSYWSGNDYEINNNLWGQSAATSGSQCTYVDSSSSSGVQWHTTWAWGGGEDRVKSYAYSGRQVTRGQTIASIASMQTSVSWEYNTDDIRANVAYDIFTAEDPDHANSGGDYEVMIWLAQYGDVPPIGASMESITIAGHRWDLWVGTMSGGSMKVFSFVASSNMGSFSGDVREFFDYLETSMGFPSNEQHLIVFQIGTEAFTGGPATMTVSEFSASISAS